MISLELGTHIELRQKLQSAARDISPGCAVHFDADKGTFSVVTAAGHKILAGARIPENGTLSKMEAGDLKFFLIDLVESGGDGVISLADAWRDWELRPGIEDIRMPAASNIIFLNVRYGESEVETVCLTPRQLRVAAEHRLSNDDLLNERFPSGWPPMHS